MFDKNIIDRVEELKLSASSRISELQKNISPMITKDIVLTEQFEYWYEGYLYPLWEDDTRLFAANFLPFSYDNGLKNNVFEGKLEDLVNEDKIFPFLLFIGDNVIKWSNIWIIKDTDYAYIKVSNVKYKKGNPVKMIYFPLASKRIRYGEDNDYIVSTNERTVAGAFYFDNGGNLLQFPDMADLSIRLEILEEGIFFTILDYDLEKIRGAGNHKIGGTNNLKYELVESLPQQYNLSQKPIYKYIELNRPVDTNTGTKLSIDHKLTLDNVLLYDREFNVFVEPTILFSYLVSTTNNVLYINPEVEDTKKYYIIVLYNTDIDNNNPIGVPKGINHMNLREFDRIKNFNKESGVTYQPGIESLIAKYKEYQDDEGNPNDLYNEFIQFATEYMDFKFDSSKTYEENITNAVSYITKYDYSLWNKMYIDSSPIKTITYTGSEFMSKANDEGYVEYSRHHTDLIEDRVMMFVNNKLYYYHMDIVYKDNTIQIPTFDIGIDDIVELVLFTKCNNSILNVKLEVDTNNNPIPVYIHPEYNLKDCYIMTNAQPRNAAYPIEVRSDGRTQYVCKIKDYTVDKNGNYKVELEDKTYYGNPKLKLVPKNQFRYYRFRNQAGRFKIILPTQFNYCHDRNRYMIFINGLKIDKNMYTITIMNENRPFDQLVLYLSTILDETDYVDVFYLPEDLNENYLEKEVVGTGAVIRLTEPNNYPKKYSLSKYTNMIFVNGRKINSRMLTDVSMSEIAVKYKPGTNTEKYNVCVVEYLNVENTLYRYLYGFKPPIKLVEDETKNDVVTLTLDGKAIELVYQEDDVKPLKLYDRWKYAVDFADNNNMTYNDGDEKFPIRDSWLLRLGLINSNRYSNDDITKNFAGLRSVLYDVLLDYYFSRYNATTGNDFVYDFETQEFDNPFSVIDERYNLPDGFTYFTHNDENTFLVDNEDKEFFGSDAYVVEVFDEKRGESSRLIPLFPDKDKLYDYEIVEKVADANKVRSNRIFKTVPL